MKPRARGAVESPPGARLEGELRVETPMIQLLARLTALTVLLAVAGCTSTSPTRTITIVHFSDYHSHAEPFFHEGVADTGGIARAMAFLRPLAARDDVLVFSGGDTMNLGAPPWSDKFRCAEWSWWNGIVDAMAFGNHDADYGPATFEECRRSADYPILGANVADASGSRIFDVGGRPYAIFERLGMQIGVFALAGSDFSRLVREPTSPVPGASFEDRIATARSVVAELRGAGADVLILIGHASTEDDEAVARAVPGIDLILGSHSHALEPLREIEGTSTVMISPGQYLTHLTRTQLHFRDGRLSGIRGELVPMSPDLPLDDEVAARVETMRRALEEDPAYARLFVPIGTLDHPLLNVGPSHGSTPLGSFVMDLVRTATETDVALSTASSFRGSLPAGPVREADLMEVLPYDNRVVTVVMDPERFRQLLDRIEKHRGTDAFSQTSPSRPFAPGRSVTVSTTDYLASVSPAYSDLFADLEIETTDLRVRQLVREALAPPGPP